MEIIEIIFFVVLVITAAIDIRSFKVPLWSLGLLVALIILQGHMHWISIIEGFLLMLSSMFICDGILGRETLGGGDLWIGTVMAGFMGFDKFLLAYTVAAGLGAIWMLKRRRYWQLDIAYVPFLTVGAIVARIL